MHNKIFGEIYQINEKIASIIKDIEELKKKIDDVPSDVKDAIDDMKDTIDDMNDKVDTMPDKLKDELGLQYGEFTDAINTDMQSYKDAISKDVNDVKDTINGTTTKAGLISVIDDCRTFIDSTKERIESLDSYSKDTRESLHAVKTTSTQTSEKLDELTSSVDSRFKTTENDFKDGLRVLENNLDNMVGNVQTVTRKANDLELTLGHHADLMSQYDSRITANYNSTTTISTGLSTLKDKVSTLDTKVVENAVKMADLEKKYPLVPSGGIQIPEQ